MTLTIYHNPRCSKSRQTLALLEERGLEPKVVHYLETPPTPDELASVLKRLGAAPRDIIRAKEAAYKERGLDDPSLSDEALIAAMTEEPILIERPIVVNGDRAKVGRPPEAVLAIL